MSSDSTSSSRELTSLSHEQVHQLLLEELGCEPFSTNSIFLRVKINGWDLGEIKCLEDLEECGILSGSRIRLKSILTRITLFQKNGVPILLINKLSSSKSASPSTPVNHDVDLTMDNKLIAETIPEKASHKIQSSIGNTMLNSDQISQPQLTATKEIVESTSCSASSTIRSTKESEQQVFSKQHIKGNADAVDGICFLQLFKSIYQKSFPKRVFPGFFLDQQQTFQTLNIHHPDEGTILHQMQLRDLYTSNGIVKAIINGEYHDQDGYIKPPQEFQKLLYGRVIVNYSSSTSVENGDTTSPYQFVLSHRQSSTAKVSPKCSFVMIPNYAPTNIGGFIFMNVSVKNKKTTATVNTTSTSPVLVPRIRLLIKNITYSPTDTTTTHNNPKTRYRTAASVNRLSPEIIRHILPTNSNIDDDSSSNSKNEVYDQNIFDCGTRVYFLWNLWTMSLMAIREGVLVLVADSEDRYSNSTRKPSYHLGVLYFPRRLSPTIVLTMIRDMWVKCKERLTLCKWEPFSQLLTNCKPVSPVVFPVLAPKISKASGTSKNNGTVPAAKKSSAVSKGTGTQQYPVWPSFKDTTGLITTTDVDAGAIYPSEWEGECDEGEETDGGIPADWYEKDEIWMPSQVAEAVNEVIVSDDDLEEPSNDVRENQAIKESGIEECGGDELFAFHEKVVAVVDDSDM